MICSNSRFTGYDVNWYSVTVRVLNLPVTLPASNLPVIYRKITGKLPVAHTLYV